MSARPPWTRKQLMVALSLYCRLPFGKLDSRNPEIIRLAEVIGRTPGALAMKLVNIASLDDAITSTGRTGLTGASARDRAMWNEMQGDWDRFAEEAQQATLEFMEAADDETAQNASGQSSNGAHPCTRGPILLSRGRLERLRRGMLYYWVGAVHPAGGKSHRALALQQAEQGQSSKRSPVVRVARQGIRCRSDYPQHGSDRSAVSQTRCQRK